MKPQALLQYPGSKARLMPIIIQLLPDHDHYVSVFGGSGNDILFKPPSRLETFNDIDSMLTNVYRVALSDDFPALYKRVQDTPPISRGIYLDALAILKKPITNTILSAWAYLVVSHQGLVIKSPAISHATLWRRLHKPCNDACPWLRLEDALDFARCRMRRVQIDNREWLPILNEYDGPRTLFYCDPPYSPDAMPRQLYANMMTLEQHAAMLDRLQCLEGYVVLSGYHGELYDSKLAHWRQHEIAVRSTIDTSGKRPHRIEVLWMNYGADGTHISSGNEGTKKPGPLPEELSSGELPCDSIELSSSSNNRIHPVEMVQQNER